ncbi:hypothetical protein [Microbacterium sp. USHLN186]|uniref:hypothetical protein n=1 Tax=Microbacterium sp. USHLN186 TaxID=3081286 RepID=UPI003018ABE5
MTDTLASVFVPLGVAGAVIASVCGLLAAIALARGAAGLAGGAAGVWIMAALLSLSASFAAVWTPLFVSVAALAGGLLLGGAARMLGRTVRARRRVNTGPAARPAAAYRTAASPTVAAKSTPTGSAVSPAARPRPVTDTVRVAS